MKIETQVRRAINKAPSIRQRGTGQHILTIGNIIYSYNTAVAVYIEGTVYVPTWHSTTTSRHINKVAQEWNAEVVKLWEV